MKQLQQPNPPTVERLKKRSVWGEVWHRLKQNKLSMVCLAVLVIMIGGIIFGPLFIKYDYATIDLTQAYQTPSAQHWMGTDDFGRDLFVRLLVGGRISLLIALLAVVIGLVFGLILGAVCGYFGSYADATIMRVMDVIMAIPGIMLAMCVSIALGSGVMNTAIALAVGTIPIITRQLRSSTMLINGQEYVEAARSFGESHMKIILTHVIPNAMAPIIVQASLYIGGGIMGIAGLSFLGLGVQPPTPEWGNILNNGLSFIYDFSSRWHLIVFPALFIVVAELAFNILGDGLRDAMDPRMRK